MVAQTESSIWQGVVAHSWKRLTPSTAKAILKLGFSKAQIDRMNKLSALAQEGDLTCAQRSEMELYNRMGVALAIMQSKARLSLTKTSRR
jgi:hypothetical protein